MAQTAKHTPGPWTYDLRANTSSVSVRGANGWAVCACKYKAPTGETTADTREIGCANAHLIAAAPELLAALKTINEAWPEIERNLLPGVLNDAEALGEITRAAIAKAEGKQP